MDGKCSIGKYINPSQRVCLACLGFTPDRIDETLGKLKKETNRPEWPLVLQPMKLLAKPEDTGLGDIVERLIGPIGGEAFKAWYLKTFGKACGCEMRKESWNRRYPLESSIDRTH